MAEIECFLLEPTEMAHRLLRRYSSGSVCAESGYGYHNAATNIGPFPLLRDHQGYVLPVPVEEYVPIDDPRWPERCACGYAFSDEDPHQMFQADLWQRCDSPETYTLGHRDPFGAPPGAMWFAWWLDGWGSAPYRERGGGPHLYVRTPGGDWDVDAKATNGEGWQRSGEAPRVTANPSIICGKYHGWLRDGVLSEC